MVRSGKDSCSSTPLIDWAVERLPSYGARNETISNNQQEKEPETMNDINNHAAAAAITANLIMIKVKFADFHNAKTYTYLANAESLTGPIDVGSLVAVPVNTNDLDNLRLSPSDNMSIATVASIHPISELKVNQRLAPRFIIGQITLAAFEANTKSLDDLATVVAERRAALAQQSTLQLLGLGSGTAIPLIGGADVARKAFAPAPPPSLAEMAATPSSAGAAPAMAPVTGTGSAPLTPPASTS